MKRKKIFPEILVGEEVVVVDSTNPSIKGLVGEIIGVKKAEIKCSIDSGKKTLQVSGAGGWEMAGIESGDGKTAQCHFHPLAINPGFPVDVNITSKQEYSDHDRSWNTTPDRVGLSGPFAYQA